MNFSSIEPNDKLMSMLWLKPSSSFTFLNTRMAATDQCPTPLASISDKSVGVDIGFGFRGHVSQKATVHCKSRETSGLYSHCHGPWHHLNGRAKTKSTGTTKVGVEYHRHWQKKEGGQEKGHITISKTKTPKEKQSINVLALEKCTHAWKPMNSICSLEVYKEVSHTRIDWFKAIHAWTEKKPSRFVW